MRMKFRSGVLAGALFLQTAGPALAQPPVPVSEAEITRGDPACPQIALVINVGAGSEPAVSMLDTLAEHEYRATFFVLGWWAERRPDLLLRIAEAGHEIGSHGH